MKVIYLSVGDSLKFFWQVDDKTYYASGFYVGREKVGFFNALFYCPKPYDNKYSFMSVSINETSFQLTRAILIEKSLNCF